MLANAQVALNTAALVSVRVVLAVPALASALVDQSIEAPASVRVVLDA